MAKTEIGARLERWSNDFIEWMQGVRYAALKIGAIAVSTGATIIEVLTGAISDIWAVEAVQSVGGMIQ